MAPRDTQGCGGGIPGDGTSFVPNKPSVGVLAPPAFAGIRPTLFLFRFRADALKSHLFFKLLNKTTQMASKGF